MPLTIATSIESSGRGRHSASARQNIAFAAPALAWPSRARRSITSLKSTPITLPPDPVRCAAISESIPAPQPGSRTVEPLGISANIETFETPANASTLTPGRPMRNSSGYSRLRANSRPTGNGCFPPGCSATDEYASQTSFRSCRLLKLCKPPCAQHPFILYRHRNPESIRRLENRQHPGFTKEDSLRRKTFLGASSQSCQGRHAVNRAHPSIQENLEFF